MQKRTFFSIFFILFIPLNNSPVFAKESINSVAYNLDNKLELTKPKTNEVQEYVSCFSVVSADVMKYALSGYAELKNEGKIEKENIITIVDFSKPSTEERLFVIDLKTKKIIEKSLCAHGKNSGEIWAEKFSNAAESYASSLGFYIANETYDGKNGFSLKLDGQEAGINDNARERGVVVHGAEYVSTNFIANNGKLGRSQGCPALPIEKTEKIISLIKGGSCFFIYHPDKNYRTHSPILKSYNESCLAEVVQTLNN